MRTIKAKDLIVGSTYYDFNEIGGSRFKLISKTFQTNQSVLLKFQFVDVNINHGYAINEDGLVHFGSYSTPLWFENPDDNLKTEEK